jgi:hypothetical protein
LFHPRTAFDLYSSDIKFREGQVVASDFQAGSEAMLTSGRTGDGGPDQLLTRLLTVRDTEWQARYDAVNRDHLAALARIEELAVANEALASEVTRLKRSTPSK